MGTFRLVLGGGGVGAVTFLFMLCLNVVSVEIRMQTHSNCMKNKNIHNSHS